MLTLETKIKILELAKNSIQNNYTFFCCVAILNSASIITKDDYFGFSKVTKYIPEFTKTNAEKVCEKYNLEKPYLSVSGGWWDCDKDSNKFREKFLECFILELKNTQTSIFK